MGMSLLVACFMRIKISLSLFVVVVGVETSQYFNKNVNTTDISYSLHNGIIKRTLDKKTREKLHFATRPISLVTRTTLC